VDERRRTLASALAAWAPSFTAERTARFSEIEGALAENARAMTETYAALWALKREFDGQGIEAPMPTWSGEALAAKQAAGRLLDVIDDLVRQRARRR
jgi:hypothetical protein